MPKSYKNLDPYAKSVLDRIAYCDIILAYQQGNTSMIDLTFIGLLILFVVACMGALMSIVAGIYIGAIFCFGYMVVTGFAMQIIADLFYK